MSAVLRCSSSDCGLLVHVPGDHSVGPLACPVCGSPLKAPEHAGQPAAGPPAVTLDLAGEAPPVAETLLDPLADGATPPDGVAEAHPGRVGRFVVRRFLGEGGFGRVYEAHDPQVDRVVALKVAKPGQAKSPERVKRFLREARAAGNLRHPNIVPVFDSGQDGEHLFIALAYIPGSSLDRYIASRAETDFRQAAVIVRKLAEALAYAHGRGVIHRDVKPANVMLDEAGEPLLMDFGLAARQEGEEKLTQEGVGGMGTPAYMAPEQAAGKPTAASDQYSLGCTLYELLTGKTPFAGPPELQLFLHQAQEVESPRKRERGVPRDLETICLKCLHKEPARRYAGCQELADDLRRWLEGEPIRARRPTLRERLARWRRRRPAASAVGIVAMCLALAACVAGWWYWDQYKRVKIGYYRQYVIRNGVQEGWGRLRVEEVRKRSLSYKCYIRGGQVEQMDIVNGTGELASRELHAAWLAREGGSRNEKVCRLVYKRNQQGELLEELGLTRRGKVLWALHYTNPTTAHYTNALGTPAGGMRGSRRESMRPGDGSLNAVEGLPQTRTRSGATYLRILRSPEGFDEARYYMDRNGNATPDDEKVWGILYNHDERGFLTELTYLGRKGQPLLHPSELFSSFRCTIDKEGNEIEWACFGPQAKPCMHRDGYHRWKSKYDEYGNQVEIAYFDMNGAPCMMKEGYHRLTKKFDDHGNPIVYRYFGIDARPCITRNGYHRFVAQYDERGDQITGTCFGADDAPCLEKNGTHRTTTSYDVDGNLIRWACYGIDDKPCFHKDGLSVSLRRYDEHGMEIDWSCFGIDGQACLNAQGYHRITRKYDERQNPVETAVFGIDGNPCLSKDGFHRTTIRFDDRGNELEWKCFGIDNKPCLSKDGFHYSMRQYDEHGYMTMWTCFGTDNRPCYHKNGYHQQKVSYDENGNQIEYATFGFDGKPCFNKDGTHRESSQFDESGKPIDWRCFSIDGKPCFHKDGYHRVVTRYDELGNQHEIAHYDIDDNPCVIRENYCKAQYLYDERGGLMEVLFFGIDGKPCLDKNGVHRLIKRYDDKGDNNSYACFGVDRKPCLNIEGYHYGTKVVDPRGNTLELRFFGCDRKPCLHKNGVHCGRKKYDALGREVELACFGIDGKPCLQQDGTHRRTTEYNHRGRPVLFAYYGVDGQPCMQQQGFHRHVLRYNEIKPGVEETYYDITGRPCFGITGYHRRITQYDERGLLLARSHFGSDGGPCMLKAGFHRLTWRYDERRNTIEISHFGADSVPSRIKAGYSRQTKRYDPLDRVIQEGYFATDGKPCMHNDGFSRLTSRYDARGNEIEVRYFDLNGKPCLNRGGYARREAKYDPLGRDCEHTDYGLDDRPLVTRYFDASGQVLHALWFADDRSRFRLGPEVARQRHTFQNGRLVEAVFLDASGSPVLARPGYARFRIDYNEHGLPARRAYFNLLDAVVPTHVKVLRVSPQSHAGKARLMAGDLLLRYDGQPIVYAFRFTQLHTTKSKSGLPGKLDLRRAGKDIKAALPP